MYNLNYLVNIIANSFNIESFYVQKDNQIYSHLEHIFCEQCPLNISQQCQASWRIGSTVSRQLNRPYLYFCPLGLSFVIISSLEQRHCLQHDFLVAGPIVMDEAEPTGSKNLQALLHAEVNELNAVQNLPHKKENTLLYIADTIYLAYRAVVYSDVINEAVESDALMQAPLAQIDIPYNLFDYLHQLSEMLFGSIAASDNEVNELVDRIVKAVQLEEYSNLKRMQSKFEKIAIYLYMLYNKKTVANRDITENQILAEVNKIAAATTVDGVRDCFTQTVYLLYRNRNHSASGTDNQLIQAVQNLVAVRYAAPLTLADIAKEMNVSYSSLSTLINKSLGKGFNQYLKEVRIQASKTLLRCSALSIAEISYTVGFADQSHFSKSFRTISGMSPQQYRTVKH